MTSLQSNSTFSFKHHLTGEAWPACRAILPFHSNTTRQARHDQLAEQFYLFIKTPLATGKACLAWSLYILRTSTIAKNRHLNIVLQAELYLRTSTCDGPKSTLAELYLRTSTYDGPKSTLAINSACAPLDSALRDRCARCR